MAHKKTKDVTASQRLHAAKPLLVLLHGTTGFSEDWSGVAVSLTENRVVIRPDYMSSKPTAGTAHTVNPGNGNNRTGGSDDHSAGYKEHERDDESAYDPGFRSHIACGNQYRCSDLGKADDIGADIRAE